MIKQGDGSINIFINLINKKTLCKGLFKKIFHKLEVRRFRKTIYEGSPSFVVLWNFADFIKYAEEIFFIENDNSEKIGVYSSRNYKSGQNGFKVTTHNVVVTVKLFNSSCSVAIDIGYRNSERHHQFSFKNEEWVNEPSVYDEMLLEEVIKIINWQMLNLFDECYDKR